MVKSYIEESLTGGVRNDALGPRRHEETEALDLWESTEKNGD